MHSSDQKRVAVLMATYNGECWIEEQLKSIIEQKDVDISIFISDDLSTDNTLNICEEFQVSYPSIINILPSVNKFGGAGKNMPTPQVCKPLLQTERHFQDRCWT